MPRKVISGVVDWADGATSTTTNQSTGAIALWGGKNSLQVNISGTGAVSVTATPEFSNDNTNWIAGSALSLSGTNSDSDGVTVDSAWAYARITLTSISGTGATVTCYHAGWAA